MAFRRVKDISVVTGTYQDASGQTRNRYANVGVVMKGDDGNSFILLSRYFNPAGVPYEDGKDKIVLSLFDPRDDNAGASRPASAPAAAAPSRAPAPAPAGDDDIPF